MSILDDAIREHLELKRAHGADEAELKRLEDEAFGPPSRPEEPDPLAEAPTEFMTPEGGEASESDEEGRRRINIADLQEPPAPPAAQEEPKVEAVETVEPEADAAPAPPAEDAAQAAPPAEESLVAEEPAADERQAIAEQPTEFFDVEAEMGTEDAPAPPATEAPSPSDEDLAEAEIAEPKLAPVEPPTEIHASRTEAPAEQELPFEEEEDEEFWSDQRLSDELDQALEAPIEHEPVRSEPAPAPPLADDDFEDDEDDAPAAHQANYDPDTGHEDVLEDTPDFLEDAPEDDELWFEQRPPKDFDFDD
ncbi:MAG TPA: hypothetical protein VFY75_05530 [Solirubrobacterales bacterium]|nr:hypothetical protein [Solirubrobacterales bacterium]